MPIDHLPRSAGCLQVRNISQFAGREMIMRATFVGKDPDSNPTGRTVTITSSSAAKQARLALGARMREIRRDAGLSGRALAAATGQHFTRVSKIEHGVQVPDEGDIRAWCRACGADDQVPDLIATARAVESAYLEFRRQSREGMGPVASGSTSTT
jgi:hypothetical protein